MNTTWIASSSRTLLAICFRELALYAVKSSVTKDRPSTLPLVDGSESDSIKPNEQQEVISTFGAKHLSSNEVSVLGACWQYT